jgi:hypothetical protein
MSERAADRPEGEKFGRPHEIGGVVRTDGERPAPSFSFQSARAAIEKYIHRENLALFEKRLAESHSDAERQMLLKLLAEEEAKEPPPKMGNLQSR